ncbi:hypothetical protein KHA94_13390 [Bacillus sp. FJAT-49705]|uniref:QacE n=1 Tax=Cytobacillus citreus TaxID=2833586 RepID=A0ABS5NTL4_9BACI|nr:DUF6232 family protein [Cytobacillus citreus]MBS4191177.1 hypothetical protein [Cytobacillus citreus]
MEEHVFLENDDILITSTRLVVGNKTIAISSVCSVELDREEIKPPWIGIAFTLIGLIMIFLLNPPSIGWIITFLGVLIIIIVLFRNRKEAVIIELLSGENEYISNEKIENLQSVFTAINDVIIFRG